MTAVYATVPGTLLAVEPAPTPQAQPGRDCPACTCERMQHTGWGCACGCQVGIVHISRRPG